MSATSSIEWTDKTWNPVRGCSVISPGCVNCYAMKTAHRFSGAGKAYDGLTKQTKAGPQWTGAIRTIEAALFEPFSWKKPQRVFVNSMSDLFHEDVPDAFIEQVFAVMALAPRHTFQVLTKRADRMRQFFDEPNRGAAIAIVAMLISKKTRPFTLPSELIFDARTVALGLPWRLVMWPLPNVWLGVSVEDQQRADERIPLLLQTPAAVRFISAEPLLGPVSVHGGLWRDLSLEEIPGWALNDGCSSGVARREPRLDWVIVGGESGRGARPLNVRWVRSIVAQCQEASAPVFVKQLGAQWYDPDRRASRRGAVIIPVGTPWTFVDRGDAKGGDPLEWPEDLRIREFPR